MIYLEQTSRFKVQVKRGKEVAKEWRECPQISLESLQAFKVKSRLTIGQNVASKNITFYGDKGSSPTEFGEFQSAEDPNKGFGHQYKKEEIDLLNFEELKKKQ